MYLKGRSSILSFFTPNPRCFVAITKLTASI
jgi:hypothetical protein